MHFIISEHARDIIFKQLTSSFTTFFNAARTNELRTTPTMAKNKEKNAGSMIKRMINRKMRNCYQQLYVYFPKHSDTK